MARDVAAVDERPAKRFRDDIQGLRGIAVLAVVAAHLKVPGLVGGFVGVDVFFVISGFLIVGLLNAEVQRTGRLSISQFYGRRARRILPAAMLVIICTVGVAQLTLNPLAVANVSQDAKWASLFAFNLLLINRGANYFDRYDSVSPLQHYWSLGVEEQFYLVVPSLFLLGLTRASHGPKHVKQRRIVGILATISVLSIAWCIYSTTQLSPTTAYFSTLTRAWQLGLGGLLAVCIANRRLRLSNRAADVLGISGLLLLGLSFVFLGSASYPGVLALLPVVGALCVLASGSVVTRDGLTQKLLSVRALTLIGLVSFSLYLWHWPLEIFAYHFRPDLAGSPLRIPLLLAAALILSALSYAYVERPARRLSWNRFAARSPQRARLVRRYGLLTALLAVTLASVAGALGVGHSTARESLAATTGEGTVASWQHVLEQSIRLKTMPSNLNPPLAAVPNDREPMRCLSVDQPILKFCRWGTPSATRTVFVIGDSHAQMWFTAIQRVFPPSQYTVQALTEGGCPNSDITPSEPGRPEAGPACDTHRRWVWGMIARLKPDVVVMSDSANFVDWAAPDGSSTATGDLGAWQQGLKRSLAQIRPYTKRIVLIGQTPRAKALADCLPRNMALKPCYGDDSYSSRLRVFERSAVAAVGGIFVDPARWLCQGALCPPVIDGTAAYFDDNHITVSMEKKLAPLLRTAIQRALAGDLGLSGRHRI
jgi:peptidoglycan/LPS O-acetylase OafA/YrhL